MWEPGGPGQDHQVEPGQPGVARRRRSSCTAPAPTRGTFDYFTEAIVGKAKASRGDYTASEDDNVLVQGIAARRERARLLRLRLLRREQGQAQGGADRRERARPAVLPVEKTVLDGTYQPLSRPIFIYVNAKSLERPEVKKFVEYYLTHGAKLAKEVKYVPLPDKAYTMNKEHLEQEEVGTVFGGDAEVGVKIEELMKREAKM